MPEHRHLGGTNTNCTAEVVWEVVSCRFLIRFFVLKPKLKEAIKAVTHFWSNFRLFLLNKSLNTRPKNDRARGSELAAQSSSPWK